jgi:hypothetical protein
LEIPFIHELGREITKFADFGNIWILNRHSVEDADQIPEISEKNEPELSEPEQTVEKSHSQAEAEPTSTVDAQENHCSESENPEPLPPSEKKSVTPPTPSPLLLENYSFNDWSKPKKVFLKSVIPKTHPVWSQWGQRKGITAKSLYKRYKRIIDPMKKAEIPMPQNPLKESPGKNLSRKMSLSKTKSKNSRLPTPAKMVAAARKTEEQKVKKIEKIVAEQIKESVFEQLNERLNKDHLNLNINSKAYISTGVGYTQSTLNNMFVRPQQDRSRDDCKGKMEGGQIPQIEFVDNGEGKF